MTIGYIVLAFFSSFLAASGQVLLKFGALKFGEGSLWRHYINYYVIGAYTLFGAVTIINVKIFSSLLLSFASIMVAFSYILVVILGRFVLKERLSNKKIMGIIVTILGMIVYSVGL